MRLADSKNLSYYKKVTEDLKILAQYLETHSYYLTFWYLCLKRCFFQGAEVLGCVLNLLAIIWRVFALVSRSAYTFYYYCLLLLLLVTRFSI